MDTFSIVTTALSQSDGDPNKAALDTYTDEVGRITSAVQTVVDALTPPDGGRYIVGFADVSTAGTSLSERRIVVSSKPLRDPTLSMVEKAVVIATFAAHEIGHTLITRPRKAVVDAHNTHTGFHTVVNLADDVVLEPVMVDRYPILNDAFEFTGTWVLRNGGVALPLTCKMFAAMTTPDRYNVLLRAVRYGDIDDIVFDGDAAKIERDWAREWAKRLIAAPVTDVPAYLALVDEAWDRIRSAAEDDPTATQDEPEPDVEDEPEEDVEDEPEPEDGEDGEDEGEGEGEPEDEDEDGGEPGGGEPGGETPGPGPEGEDGEFPGEQPDADDIDWDDDDEPDQGTDGDQGTDDDDDSEDGEADSEDGEADSEDGEGDDVEDEPEDEDGDDEPGEGEGDDGDDEGTEDGDDSDNGDDDGGVSTGKTGEDLDGEAEDGDGEQNQTEDTRGGGGNANTDAEDAKRAEDEWDPTQVEKSSHDEAETKDDYTDKAAEKAIRSFASTTVTSFGAHGAINTEWE